MVLRANERCQQTLNSAQHDDKGGLKMQQVYDRRPISTGAQAYMLVPEAMLTVQVYDVVSTVPMFSSYWVW